MRIRPGLIVGLTFMFLAGVACEHATSPPLDPGPAIGFTKIEFRDVVHEKRVPYPVFPEACKALVEDTGKYHDLLLTYTATATDRDAVVKRMLDLNDLGLTPERIRQDRKVLEDQLNQLQAILSATTDKLVGYTDEYIRSGQEKTCTSFIENNPAP